MRIRYVTWIVGFGEVLVGVVPDDLDVDADEVEGDLAGFAVDAVFDVVGVAAV